MSHMTNISGLTAYQQAVLLQNRYPNRLVGIMLMQNRRSVGYAVLQLNGPKETNREGFPFYLAFPTERLSCGFFTQEEKRWNFKIITEEEKSCVQQEMQTSFLSFKENAATCNRTMLIQAYVLRLITREHIIAELEDV